MDDGPGGLHDMLRVREWTVRGASKVVGDAEVGFARVEGLATVGGSLAAADVSVRGELTVLGSVRVAGPLRVWGTARLPGAVRAGELELEGRLEAGADLTVDGRARLCGRIDIAGALAASELAFEGTLLAPGEVRAKRVEGVLVGECRTGPIRADFLELKRARSRLPPWRASGALETLRIEAREVRLEAVTVEFLRADTIFLGPDCRVARYEGRVLDRHPSSRLGPSAVSVIPPGLSR